MATLTTFSLAAVLTDDYVDDTKWAQFVTTLQDTMQANPDITPFFSNEVQPADATEVARPARELLNNPLSLVRSATAPTDDVSIDFDIDVLSEGQPVLVTTLGWTPQGAGDDDSQLMGYKMLPGQAPPAPKPNASLGWQGSLDSFTKSLRALTGDNCTLGVLDQSTSLDVGFYGPVSNGVFNSMGSVFDILEDEYCGQLKAIGVTPPKETAPIWNQTIGGAKSIMGGGGGGEDGIEVSCKFVFSSANASAFRSGPISSWQITNAEKFGHILQTAWNDRNSSFRSEFGGNALIYRVWSSQLTFYTYAAEYKAGLDVEVDIGPAKELGDGKLSIGFGLSDFSGTTLIIPNTADAGSQVFYDPSQPPSIIGYRALTLNRGLNLNFAG